MKQRVIVCALVEKDGKYLFIRQNKPGGAYPGTLHTPGGGVDPGEDLEQAIRREVREEAGIEIADVTPVGFAADVLSAYKGEPHQLIFLRYRARYESGAPKPGDDATEVMWVAPANFSENPMNPATQSLLNDLGLLGG